MKHFIISLLISGLFLASCSSSKDYLERKDEDKSLQDAVKKLQKSPGDDKAADAIPVLYASIKKNNLAEVKSLQQSRELSKWDKILDRYNNLQEAYNAIINTTAAFKLVTPENYSTQILETKQSAAEMYYDAGLSYLDKPGRDNAKKAFTTFKKAGKYISNYKDVTGKMNEAYEKAVVDVVINPVQDNSFFFNSGWGNSGYNYSNEYFQQTLVRELSNQNNRYPARFYTDWEARRLNVQPDWVVDLHLRNMDIPQPFRNTYQRQVSKQVEAGRDTSGRVIYRNVFATLNVTRLSFTARADMEVSIKETSNGRNISNNSYRDDYRWEQEQATYSGDSRALSSYDWNLVNNNNSYNNTPRKEEILNELYRKIYPQVKNNITYAVDW